MIRGTQANHDAGSSSITMRPQSPRPSFMERKTAGDDS